MGEDRKPQHLFKVLNELCNSIPTLKNDLEIRLMGNVDYSVIESIKEQNLYTYTNLTGSVSRKKVIESISESSVLLLLINKAYNASARIPAKIFEYIRTGNKILALGPLQSDINDLLQDIKRPGTIEYDNVKKLKQFIETAYQEYMDKKENTIIDPSVVKLSNREITKKLANFLNQVSK